MKIKIFQIKPKCFSMKENLSQIMNYINQAYKEKADIVCFSECALTGYPLEDRFLFEETADQIKESIEAVVVASQELKQFYIILPTPFPENGKFYNSALIISQGSIIARADKSALPNYGVFDEKRYFIPGKGPAMIKIKDKNILIPICEDIWNEDYVKKALKLSPDVIICPNGSPFEKKKIEKRLENARKFKGVKFIYINQVLAYDEIIFDGRSFMIEENGDISLFLKEFEHDEALIDLSKSYSKLAISEHQEKIVYQAIVFSLREYLLQNNFKGVMIGISGGIDSALCAKIAADAIGPENVDCVFLPTEINSEGSGKDAKDFAQKNNIPFREIPIQDIYEDIKKACASNEDITKQNIQSRIRAVILMTLSNESGKMMVATGNKSESAIGYCTLYGDTNGGYNPIADIYKTEVYSMCNFLNKTGDIFPKNILRKPPSAELKKGQTDETSFGVPYIVLDFILQQRVEEKLSLKSIVERGENLNIFDIAHSFRKENHLPCISNQELVEKVWDMVKKAQYKRMQSPPGAKVSKCAFGRDWRFGNNL